MAAVCPAGLLLTHIMPLCESEAGAPSVGQIQPCARGAALESVLSPSGTPCTHISHGCLLPPGAEPLQRAFPDPSGTCEANEGPAGT